jgi:lysophospholipase L1-like esterase
VWRHHRTNSSNEKGYRVWTEALKSAIEEAWKKARR